MIKIESYAGQEIQNVVIANVPESIAYKSVDEENDHILSFLKENEYYFNAKHQKVYLVSPNLQKSASFISKLGEQTLIYMDSFLNQDNSILELAKTMTEELIIQNYTFNELKTNSKIENKCFYLTTFLRIEYQFKIQEGIYIGEAVHKSRRLIDLPLNYLNAVQLAEYTHNLERENANLKVKTLGLKEIQDLKMGAFLAVNLGSYIEPRLIEISYFNNPKSTEFIQLIGKGLTFDTGGYTLKDNMVNMKSDMAGASIVISVVEAVAKMGLPVNLKVLVLATDNKLSSNSLVPDDVITSMAGKTIEIVSTDAEGRLTLCDALTYSIQNNAVKIIDIATLTGSAARTFGKNYTACFSNSAEFLEPFMKVCNTNKEKLWQLPLDDEYFEGIKSEIADMKNSGPIIAGASVAAIFLKQFLAENTEWIHLDIAGTATDSKGFSTGILVRSFIEYFRTLCC